LVYPDSGALNDPKLAAELLQRDSSDERSTKVFEVTMRHRFGRPQNSDAGVLGRPKQQGIAKVQIELNHSAAFVTTARNEIGVGGTRHLLARHGCCVMARRLK
jgi:hypothetical protein